MRKFRKVWCFIIIVTFLCQSVVFGTPEKSSTLRLPLREANERLEEAARLLQKRGKRKADSGQEPLASNQSIRQAYEDKVYPLTSLDFEYLPQGTKDILIRVGISDGVVELAKATGENAWRVFRFSLPQLIQEFGIDFIEEHWDVIVELAKATGKNADYLFQDDLATLKEIIIVKGDIDKTRANLRAIGGDLAELYKTAGKNANYLFQGAFGDFIQEFGIDFIKEHWDDIVELAKTEGEDVGILFRYGLPNVKQEFGIDFIKDNWRSIVSQLLKLRNNTTDYNRTKILGILLNTGHLHLLASKKASLIAHLEFYNTIISENRRLAYMIAGGIVDGIKTGEVDINLPDSEKDLIRDFIEEMRGFNPLVFSSYKEEGREALEPLRENARKVLKDGIGEEDIREFLGLEAFSRFNEDQRYAILSSSIQMAIPTSGASFVGLSEVSGLLKKFIEAGDRRKDIPLSLRDRDFGEGEIDALSIDEWRVKEGQKIDPEGNIDNIIRSLGKQGLPDEERKDKERGDKDKLIAALTAYLEDRGNEDKRRSTLKAFYDYASHDDLLQQKIDSIQDIDYLGVLLLEQLFIDKDNLSVLLRELLKDISLPDVSIRYRDIPKPKGFVGNIRKLWRNDRINEIARLLESYDITQIRGKILPLVDDNPELHTYISSLLEDPRPTSRPLTEKEVIESLFKEPLKMIQREKQKFELKEGTKQAILEFRVVKGIPHGLWGLNAGVCVATDLELWKDKRFFLLEIFDRETERVTGYVHLFEVEIDGERVLTLPGIEPSTEFLSEVKTEDFYPILEEALLKIKEKGGYKHLYIPTTNNIASNRPSIVKIISKRYGEPITLPKAIYWNRRMKLVEEYPFQEVWEVKETIRDRSDDAQILIRWLNLAREPREHERRFLMAAISLIDAQEEARYKKWAEVARKWLESTDELFSGRILVVDDPQRKFLFTKKGKPLPTFAITRSRLDGPGFLIHQSFFDIMRRSTPEQLEGDIKFLALIVRHEVLENEGRDEGVPDTHEYAATEDQAFADRLKYALGATNLAAEEMLRREDKTTPLTEKITLASNENVKHATLMAEDGLEKPEQFKKAINALLEGNEDDTLPRVEETMEKLTSKYEIDITSNWKSIFINDNPIIVEVGCSEGAFPKKENIVLLSQRYPGKNFVGIDRLNRPELQKLIERKAISNVRLVWGSDRNVFVEQFKINREIIDEILLIAPGGSSSIFLADKITIEAIAGLLKLGGRIKIALEEGEQKKYKLDLPEEDPDSLIAEFKKYGIAIEKESHSFDERPFEYHSPRYYKDLKHHYVFRKQQPRLASSDKDTDDKLWPKLVDTVREFQNKEQTLNILLEEAVSKNTIADFYNSASNYYMTINTWPSLLEESYKKLSEISNSLGDWCVVHNTLRENVNGILKKGIKPGKVGTGFMIYDFKNRDSVEFGLSKVAWQVMRGKLSTEGLMGYVELDNIVAIIGDKSDTSIMMNAEDIQDRIDSKGHCFYDVIWRENATAQFAVDLSIDKENLNAVINAFIGKYREIPEEHKEVAIARLKQIAIVYIWMERLNNGMRFFASQPNLKDRLDSLKRDQDVMRTRN